jgi:hypothetical protein
MKRVLFILLFCLSVSVQGQIIRANSFHVSTSAVSVVSYSETFASFSNGNLGGQTPWVACLNTITVTADKNVTTGATADNCAYVNLGFSNNQSSKGVLTRGAAGVGISVAVRCSGSGATATYYELYCGNPGFNLYKVVNGTSTQLTAGGGTTATNDIIELKITGTTLTCYQNGTLIAGLGDGQSGCTGTAGTYTDSSIASGKPGISGYGSGTAFRLDNYEASDL